MPESAAPMMGTELVPLSELTEDPENARKGDVVSIRESLKEFGQHRPVVVQRSTNRIIAGNHLYKAAKSLGWTEIGVFYVDDDDVKAVRRGLADNAVGDAATWDLEVLALNIEKVGDDIPGFNPDLLDDLKDLGKEEETEEITYEIAPKLDEQFNCLVVFCKSQSQWMLLKTILELESQRSFKGTQVGESTVLPADKLLELLRGKRE